MDNNFYNNIKVIATFNNCGTLNGKSINMVVTYSKFVRDNPYEDTINLYWTAFGKPGLEIEGGNQKSSTEWQQSGFSDFKVEISFYDVKQNSRGNTNPIGFNNIYMTFYSLDGSKVGSEWRRREGVSSDSPYLNDVILFKNTAVQETKNDTSFSTAKIYFGTIGRGSSGGSLDAACLNWKARGNDKVKTISFYEHVRGRLIEHGYHLYFSGIAKTRPPIVNNEVDDFKLVLANGQIMSSNGTNEGVMELEDIKYIIQRPRERTGGRYEFCETQGQVPKIAPVLSIALTGLFNKNLAYNILMFNN